MKQERKLKKDHWLSLAVSVIVNGALFTAFMLYMAGEPRSAPQIIPAMIIDAAVTEEIEELELELFQDMPESDLMQDFAAFEDFDVDLDFSPEPDQEVVDISNMADLDSLASLLTDIVSPVTLLGAGQGIPVGGGLRGFGGEGGTGADLTGTLFDLKRNRAGEPRRFDFSGDIRRMMDAGFQGRVMNDFYRVPRQLSLSHLFIPRTPADAAPESFGVADYMEPRGWVVHYQGYIQPSVPGMFRFVGDFDDVIIVKIDGEVVLESNWGRPATDWRPQQSFNHRGLLGRNLVYGDWIPIQNRPHRIDLIIGENPGGHVGGLLLVQQEGVRHREGPNGRPILPLFTLHPFTERDLERFTQSDFDLDLERVPLFGMPMRQPAPARSPNVNDDIIRIELL